MADLLDHILKLVPRTTLEEWAREITKVRSPHTIEKEVLMVVLVAKRTRALEEEVAAWVRKKLVGDQVSDARTTRSVRNVGSQGGLVRAQKLSPERRREIAQQAARARWGKA